jgi:hypothetical protein
MKFFCTLLAFVGVAVTLATAAPTPSGYASSNSKESYQANAELQPIRKSPLVSRRPVPARYRSLAERRQKREAEKQNWSNGKSGGKGVVSSGDDDGSGDDECEGIDDDEDSGNGTGTINVLDGSRNHGKEGGQVDKGEHGDKAKDVEKTKKVDDKKKKPKKNENKGGDDGDTGSDDDSGTDNASEDEDGTDADD